MTLQAYESALKTVRQHLDAMVTAYIHRDWSAAVREYEAAKERVYSLPAPEYGSSPYCYQTYGEMEGMVQAAAPFAGVATACRFRECQGLRL